MITHLACVMDGNRRWAQRQGLLSFNGHRAGAQKVEMVMNLCLQLQISYLSLYTFSLENFQRSAEEKSYLFDMIAQQAEQYLSRFVEQGVSVKFIGNLLLFPDTIQQICHRVEQQTKEGTKLQINFLFGYGARQEIFAAAQKCAAKMMTGTIITQQDFAAELWTCGIPDPDLIVRTGGQKRLSNFLLYQAAYAEIRFLDTLWPDITEKNLLDAIADADASQKNIGK